MKKAICATLRREFKINVHTCAPELEVRLIRIHFDDASHRIKSNDFNVGFFYRWLLAFSCCVSFFSHARHTKRTICRRYLKSINYEGR